MSKFLWFVIAVMLPVLSVAVPSATANDSETIRPLSEEPLPLSIDPSQWILIHRVTPPDDVCTPLTNGNCAESIEVWFCPSGPNGQNPLSVGARNRLSQTYAETIINGLIDGAARDSHCELNRYEPRSANITPAVPVQEGCYVAQGVTLCPVTADPGEDLPTPAAGDPEAVPAFAA